ncbi:MAG: DUF72 domain-containing protein [Acidobacteria bacterium]|nr:DUF72 domain-containing protein [Acidobacteriota bacterium]
MIYIGTSGYSYSQWKKKFYPEKLPSKKFLSYYAGQFSTVEINNTFYRSPSVSLAESWSAQVPQSFRFSLKLNQKITHQKRLNEVDEDMKWFLSGAAGLETKLACVLVQLPPYFRKETSLLQDFLEKFSATVRLAVEFRHPSWFTTDVLELLAKHGCSLAVVEGEQQSAVRERTAEFVYVRLRKAAFASHELDSWAEWFFALPECYVYFKHDDRAPLLAQELQRRLAEGESRL